MSDDYVMVPREPTPEMLAAILEPIKWAGGVHAYRAMIAAAPPAAPAPVMRNDAESDYALDERMDEVLPLSAAPVVPKPEYSDEEVERAIITLRGITQEIRGRGIDAVMLLEEQIKSLSAAPVVREPQPLAAVNRYCAAGMCLPTDKHEAGCTAHGIGGGNG